MQNLVKKFSQVIIALMIATVSLTAWSSEIREIYLTRHAEKQNDGTRNPSLTEVGLSRAEYLAQFLKQKNITMIYSTNYKRTMETAQPTALALGLKIEHYDPRNLKTFAEQLKAMKGNVLVVGHSNTTPELAVFLTGEEKISLSEKEFDRLYQINFKSGKAITHILRTEPVQTEESRN